MPPRTAPAQPVLEINQRPVRDLAHLLELLGQVRVERELNVHRTTIKRWLKGQVKIPGHQHQVIRMLLGDLPGTAGQWHGWGFRDGELYSPGGDRFCAGDVISLIYLRQQLHAREQELVKLKAQLAILEQALAHYAPAANEPLAGRQRA